MPLHVWNVHPIVEAFQNSQLNSQERKKGKIPYQHPKDTPHNSRSPIFGNCILKID
jgi:hypothetical protein